MTSRVLQRILWGPDKPEAGSEGTSSRMTHSEEPVTSDPSLGFASSTALEKLGPLVAVESNIHSPHNLATPTDEHDRGKPGPNIIEGIGRHASEDPTRPATWAPSFFHIRALAGLSALVLTGCCVLASLTVLLVSDGQPVERWPVQPTVYLAIVAAVAHSSLALAHTQAVPITWWYHATRGASIRALEQQWHISNSLIGTFVHGRHLSVLTLACIATSFVILDGPLLQRASTVVAAQRARTVTLDLQLLPELQTGFSGAYINHEIMYKKSAWLACRDYTENRQIAFQTPRACEGTCRATVQGPAVAKMNCSSQEWPIDSKMIHDPNATWGNWKSYGSEHDGGYTDNPAFYVKLVNGQVVGYPVGATREAAVLTVGLATWFEFNGSYVETTCYLHPAIAEYEVILQDNVLTLTDNPNQGHVVALANNTPPANIQEVNKVQPTTIDGLTIWLSMLVSANASVAISTNPRSNGTYSMDMATFSPMVVQHMDFSDHAYSDLTFKDPTSSVIDGLNQLMLRGAVMVSNMSHVEQGLDPSVSITQTVEAHETKRSMVFRSDLRWYAGAAVLEIVTILLLLVQFFGWWELESGLTLSPFSIALAMDAPLLGDVNSAAGARGVVDQIGDTRVKFGAVVDGSSAGVQSTTSDSVPARLGFSGESNVLRPRRGARFAK